MKKTLLSTFVWALLSLLSVTGINAQQKGYSEEENKDFFSDCPLLTQQGIEEFEKSNAIKPGCSSMEGHPQVISRSQGKVVVLYGIKLRKGYVYNFSAAPFDCHPDYSVKGLNDLLSDYTYLSLHFISYDRRQYFRIDKDWTSLESFTLTSQNDESLVVAVETRCRGFRLPVWSNDPSASYSSLVRFKVDDNFDFLKHFATQLNLVQIQPPPPDTTASAVENQLAPFDKTINQKRDETFREFQEGTLSPVIPNTTYEELLQAAYRASMRLRSGAYSPDSVLGDFDKQLLQIKENLYGPLKNDEYYLFLKTPETIRSYQKDLDARGASGETAELRKGLDEALAYFNQTIPKFISDLTKKRKETGKPLPKKEIFDAVGPAYNQIYHRLNIIKRKGMAGGWSCQFATTTIPYSSTTFPSPFCVGM